MRQNYFKILFLISFLKAPVIISLGQDISYSVYSNTPLQVNPGLIGTSDDLSVILANRGNKGIAGQQFNSIVFTGLYPINLKSNQRIGGIGINVFSDRSGEPNILNHLGISTGLSYNLRINKNLNLNYGAQVGYFQRKISLHGLTTTSQYIDNYGFDPTVGTGENFNDQSIRYFSISSGLYLYHNDENGKNDYYLGVSGFDLNRANASFTRSSSRNPIKFSFHGGFRAIKKNNISITPEFYYSTVSSTHLLFIGPIVNFSFISKPFGALKSGDIDIITKYSTNNFIISGLKLNQPNYSITLSYDFNVSSTAKSSGKVGIFEISLAFRKSMLKKKTEYKTVGNYSVGEVREFFENEKPLAINKEYPNNSDNIFEESHTQEDSLRPEEPIKFALKREFKFKFNDSQIVDDEDKKFLEDILKLLNSNSKLKMEIIGHTDNTGTDEANLKISVQRAQTVSSYLVSKGVDQKRLIIIGKGSKEPIVTNSSDVNRAVNRRVEFIIYK